MTIDADLDDGFEAKQYDSTGRYNHVVTLNSKADLETFYSDMENASSKPNIPDRPVECLARRPFSRNTEYNLTKQEAEKLRLDPRVKAIETHPSLRGVSAGLMVTQYSQYFNKSSTNPSGNIFSSTSNVWVNWGLLRCYNGANTPGWGGNGNTMASGNVVINTMGRNVDVVVVDGGSVPIDHPEYSVNADGSGGSRVNYLNWYQWNPEVTGGAAGTYNVAVNYHTTHVTGTIGGNTQGWARAANMYNIYYAAGPDGTSDYVFDYVQQFHATKPVNPETGIRNPTICNNSWGYSIFPSQWSFSDITQVTYRGNVYTPSNPGTTGYNGVCSDSTEYANLGNSLINSGQLVITGAGTASVVPDSGTLYGTSNLAASTTPTVGDNDDGYWSITPPWATSYLGTSYAQLYLGTNWYLTFGGPSQVWSGIDANTPFVPKICFSAGDRRINTMYQGATGTAGSRIYIIRGEGNSQYNNISTNTVFELWLYEANPDRISVRFGANGTYGPGTFTTQQLNSWGFISGKRIPLRVASLDADVEDSMDAGIIMVGAAGNGSWKHDLPGGIDWDNTFMMNNRYPGEVFHYMRGSSPTAVDTGMPNICVGAAGYTLPETKADFSDCGPGVDMYSPGYYISSAYTSGATDPRDRAYYQYKISGTSMASPQVCGMVASALELYPRWQQQDAKTWVLDSCASDQLTAGSGGPTDFTDLQGGDNLYMTMPTLVPTEGQVVPTQTYGNPPSSGQVYPRTRIFIYGGT